MAVTTSRNSDGAMVHRFDDGAAVAEIRLAEYVIVASSDARGGLLAVYETTDDRRELESVYEHELVGVEDVEAAVQSAVQLIQLGLSSTAGDY